MEFFIDGYTERKLKLKLKVNTSVYWFSTVWFSNWLADVNRTVHIRIQSEFQVHLHVSQSSPKICLRRTGEKYG